MQQQWLEFKQTHGFDTKAVNVKQETDLVNAATCISDYPHYRHYRIVGDKAQHFLQGQLTNDLEALSDVNSLYAAHCNLKGRIIGLYHVWQQGADIYLQIEESIANKAIAALEKYAKFSRVSIQRMPELMTLTLWGSHASAFLAEQFSFELKSKNNFFTNNQIALIQLPSNTEAYHLVAPIETCQELWPALTENFTPISDNGSKYFYLTAGLARLAEPLLEVYTPHELGLPKLGAVNFNKGCYTGQEIIARMEFRGKVKSHLYHGVLNSRHALADGINLMSNDRVCGSIINSVKMDDDQYLVLALLQDKAIDSDVSLENTDTVLLNPTRLSY